jgi:beta-glucosidase-like glycosyl hydrolase
MPTAGRRRRGAALLCALTALLTACSSPGRPAPAAQTSASTPAATTSRPPGPEERAAAVLAGLDRRARISQLFIVGVPLDDLGSGDASAQSGVGGLFLAGRSEAPATELAATAQRWQSLSPGPSLWLAADQEGGAVQSLKGPGFERLPSALDQGALPPGDLAALADGMGTALHDAGLNLDLAPVADVVPAGTEAANAPIGAFDRQYGSTPESVSAAAGTVIDGLARSGVTATLKHFPGLGRVQENTDTATGVTDSVTTPDDAQVALFGDLARSHADPFVMVSSAIYALIDPTQEAAFSPVVVTDLLRERLGFDGVVISDDLGIALAVSTLPPGERAVRFLAAGGTLVLTAEPTILPEMIDAVLERSQRDPAFAATVDDAVRTALTAKDRAGLLAG